MTASGRGVRIEGCEVLALREGESHVTTGLGTPGTAGKSQFLFALFPLTVSLSLKLLFAGLPLSLRSSYLIDVTHALHLPLYNSHTS